MPILFSYGVSFLKFDAPVQAIGMVSKTICFKVNPATLVTGNGWFLIWDGAGTDTDEAIIVFVSGATNTKLSFQAHFSTTNGVWTTTNAVLTAGVENSIIIVYSGANVANNPTIYINGVSVAVTRNTAPVGTYRTGAVNNYITMGAMDGTLKDVRMYEGPKSAAQAAVIADEDIAVDATIDTDNLAFFAPLMMCKGLTYGTFVGATLAGANEFYDNVNGYLGVPNASPVGA